jgi:hypothetical protein
MQLLYINNKKTDWQFNEVLTLSHAWSVTFVVPSCSWYTQLAVYIYAPILTISYNLKSGHSLTTSFVEVNCSLTPAIPFECHQPKLINCLSQSSIQMPLAKTNHSFVPVIHLNAISQNQSFICPSHPFECHYPKLINCLSQLSLHMQLVRANHLFIPAIPLDAISQS